jgi:phosphoserine phosphatase
LSLPNLARMHHGPPRMNIAAQCSSYDASPEEAIEAIGRHDGPLFVDLDETLYLGNSTEDFINLASPALLALLIMRVLDALRPWRWTGGDSTRDTWRIRAIRTLLPWTQWRWHRHVGRLAAQYCNRQLVSALQEKERQVIVVTLGFQPVVRPLVAALGFPNARIIAARADSFEDRRQGKLHSAINELGHELVGASLFVTDSLDDLPLLSKCARPLRTVWPAARFRRALATVYLPSEYVAQVKHPGQRYLWRVIVQEDYAFWLLSTIGLAANPWMHAVGIAVLLSSFWTIYERGYVDNDWVAEHLEDDGKLSGNYWHAPVATPWLQPWVWAVLSGALAVYILDWPAIRPWDLAKWVAVLLATYGTFKIYNRIDKRSRIWMYGALQFARAASFLVLVPGTVSGVAALGALILARWVAYYVYRINGGNWPELPVNLIRLLFFALLAGLLAVTLGPGFLLRWTAPAILTWNVFRARGELANQVFASRRVGANVKLGP